MLLTVKEVAELKNCSTQYVQKLIKDGKLPAQESENPSNGIKQYLVAVSALPEKLQKRYYAQLLASGPSGQVPELKERNKPAKRSARKAVAEKPLEEYTAKQRAEIDLWCEILKRWQEERNLYQDKLKADEDIIGAINLDLHKRKIDLKVNRDMLYRKFYWYKNHQLGGLIDDRGGHNKGKSSIPQEIWEGFLFYYLDDRQPPLSTVYQEIVDWSRDFYPDLVSCIPHERSFRRRLSAEVPKAIITLFRKGQKALDDECLMYIERLYDGLEANDCWVTDNHTLDIQTQYDDTPRASSARTGIHRLYLTAFMDAKSGIITGFNITDNPSMNSTLFALKMGIERYGKPKTILADNGS